MHIAARTACLDRLSIRLGPHVFSSGSARSSSKASSRPIALALDENRRQAGREGSVLRYG